jgi:hypothetical protein
VTARTTQSVPPATTSTATSTTSSASTDASTSASVASPSRTEHPSAFSFRDTPFNQPYAKTNVKNLPTGPSSCQVSYRTFLRCSFMFTFV